MAEPHPLLAAIRELDLAVGRLRNTLAHDREITVADTFVLSRLGLDETMRPHDIAAALHLGTGTLTAMLDRLERAQMITRVPNPDDRRSTLVRLHPHGRRALDHYAERLVAAAEAALTPDERDTFPVQMRALAVSLLHQHDLD